MILQRVPKSLKPITMICNLKMTKKRKMELQPLAAESKNYQTLLANIAESMIPHALSYAMSAKNGFVTVEVPHQDRILSITWSEPSIKKWLYTKMVLWVKRCLNVIPVAIETSSSWVSFLPRLIRWLSCFVDNLVPLKIRSRTWIGNKINGNLWLVTVAFYLGKLFSCLFTF